MKAKSTRTCGFIYARNLLGCLLTASGLCLLMISFGSTALGNSKRTTKDQFRATSVAPHQPNAPDAVPASGTLDPSNRVLTYTDGPLAPNPTGILGAPICSAPMSC